MNKNMIINTMLRLNDDTFLMVDKIRAHLKNQKQKLSHENDLEFRKLVLNLIRVENEILISRLLSKGQFDYAERICIDHQILVGKLKDQSYPITSILNQLSEHLLDEAENVIPAIE